MLDPKTEPTPALNGDPRSGKPAAPQPALLELLVADTAPPPRIDGVVVGQIVGFEAGGAPLVDFYQNPTQTPLAARSTVALAEAHVHRDVALLFEQGDPRRPIVIGLMWQPEEPEGMPLALVEAVDLAKEDVTVRSDGERLTLTADKEIVLRCGKASITLTRAGKVLLRGTYLLSRSCGVNRIKGGSVQIN